MAHDLMDDLEEVLLDERAIATRVAEMGAQISADYYDKDLVLIGILRGAVVFLSDLTRAIPIPHSLDMMGASSYGKSTVSQGFVRITNDVSMDLENKDVLVIEDIYDSGRTLAVVRDMVQAHKPRSIELCAFLWKEVGNRAANLDVKYHGFRIPDKFVVGYGLDYSEHYRNLPVVGVLKPEVYMNR
ncbi:MAG: hypoxanthine phosphoribosyltransferase [Candidatus Sumerlaeia bacterium]|nr:hypoxanthine phosphoribosyltransferase [Candidatus Sumerlaeia bacterium]